MAHAAAEVVLWLFVVNLGIAFGAGLYEARVAVPQWLKFEPGAGYRWDAAAARRAGVGMRFWAYVTTGPLTLLMLASLGSRDGRTGPCVTGGWPPPRSQPPSG